jgi:hypothetical protein
MWSHSSSSAKNARNAATSELLSWVWVFDVEQGDSLPEASIEAPCGDCLELGDDGCGNGAEALVADMLRPRMTGRARLFPRGAADQPAKPPV